MPHEIGKRPVHRVPAAEHPVAIGPDISNEGLDLVPGNEVLVQHHREDLDRGLELLSDHLVRAEFLQVLYLADIPRTIIDIFFSESGMELFHFVELKIIQIIDPVVNKQ